MRILLLATEDYLGAGKAALRIYNTLKKENQVCLLVKNKISNNDPNILKYSDLIPKPRYNKLLTIKSTILAKLKKPISTDPDFYFFAIDNDDSKVNINAVLKKLPFTPDIILVTWTSNFLNAEDIYLLQKATKAKIVFYPMDMSTLTGGCHYAWNCDGYLRDCSNCPAILDVDKKDLAKEILSDKKKFLKASQAHLIVGSEQLLLEARQSTLFKSLKSIPKIRIPIDEQIFNRNVRSLAKTIFGIPENCLVIFFGASVTNERRKGFALFLEAINILFRSPNLEKCDKDRIVVLLGGNIDSEIIKQIPFRTVFAGYISDDRLLSIAYQASTVFVTSSIQDSGPMMINEAIMCGTPVVSFNIGVAKDLIINGKSGYIVNVGNTLMLSQSIEWILKLDKESFEEMSIMTQKIGLEMTGKDTFAREFKKLVNEIV